MRAQWICALLFPPWWTSFVTQRSRLLPSGIRKFAAYQSDIPQSGQSGRPRRNVDTDRVNRRRRGRISVVLGHCLPFDAKIVRQTDAQDPVWPLSFWKEVCRQYQCEWRAPNFIVILVGAYVNRDWRRQELTKTNRILLRNLTFLASNDTA